MAGLVTPGPALLTAPWRNGHFFFGLSFCCPLLTTEGHRERRPLEPPEQRAERDALDGDDGEERCFGVQALA